MLKITCKFVIFLMLFINNNIYAQQEDNKLSFKEIFFSNQGNASDKWENYLEIYNEVFQKFRGKHPYILEIGVQNGGNLQNFHRFFENAYIFGLDIDPKVCEMDLGNNIKTFCFSALDRKRIEDSFKDISFDVILDDGSHICQEVIETFHIFFSKLKPGGVYLIEDLHTSYWESHEGGYLKENTSIEFLKKLVDLLNLYHIKDPNYKERLSAKEKYIFEWLESISFYDSVAVIKKLKEPRKESYKRFVVGKSQPVTPAIDDAKKGGFYYTN